MDCPFELFRKIIFSLQAEELNSVGQKKFDRQKYEKEYKLKTELKSIFRPNVVSEFDRAHPTAVSQEYAMLTKDGKSTFYLTQGLKVFTEDSLKESLDNFFDLDSREEQKGDEEIPD